MDSKHNDRRIFDLAMHTWLRYALVFLKWLLWAAVIGTALGFISTAFHYSVDFAQELRLAYPWLLCLLPDAYAKKAPLCGAFCHFLKVITGVTAMGSIRLFPACRIPRLSPLPCNST